MNGSESQLNRRFVVICLLFIALFVSVTLYAAQGNRFAAPMATVPFRPPLINPEIIQNWLPSSAYTYTIARIDDYLQTNNLPATSMTAVDTVSSGSGRYDFSITILPQNETIGISIVITNYGGSGTSLGTAVTIAGKLQTPVVPGQSQAAAPSTPEYSGFDALVSVGATAIQANELQQAIQEFRPSATIIRIDTTSITSMPSTDGSTVNYTFPLAIDNKTYSAEFKAIGLARSQLILKDTQNSKQVFNSGTMSQGI